MENNRVTLQNHVRNLTQDVTDLPRAEAYLAISEIDYTTYILSNYAEVTDARVCDAWKAQCN